MGVAERVSTSTWRKQFLELFLVRHAEALFLVDDDEAEVLEADVAGDEAVGADDDVDRCRRRGRRWCRGSRAAVRKRLSRSMRTG